jgi:hypothetical protein
LIILKCSIDLKVPFLSKKVVASKENLGAPDPEMSLLKEETNALCTS